MYDYCTESHAHTKNYTAAQRLMDEGTEVEQVLIGEYILF